MIMKAFEAVLTPNHGLSGVRGLLASLPDADVIAIAAASSRNAELTKPPGALGRLEDVAVWLAGWQGTATPGVTAPAIAVFAGNHAVTQRGVSPYPSDVTAQMVANFAAGGAAINQICQAGGIQLSVHPIDLDHPAGDIADGAAMTETSVPRHFGRRHGGGAARMRSVRRRRNGHRQHDGRRRDLCGAVRGRRRALRRPRYRGSTMRALSAR